MPAWPADKSHTRAGPVGAAGAVDAQNAPTAPWKTLLVFHELPQGFPHPITHDKPRKSPESYWETRIDPFFLPGAFLIFRFTIWPLVTGTPFSVALVTASPPSQVSSQLNST